MVIKYMRKRGLSPFLGTVPFLLFFIFCFSSSVKAEEGLAGWWKFDEGSGDVLHDSSGNGDDGMIYGATWVKGITGLALMFDGKDDYVNCLNTSSTQLDGPLTISAWVNIPADAVKDKTNNWYLVSRHDWNIGIGDNLMPFFEFWNSVGGKRVILSAERKIPTDEWIHLVGVYSVKNEVIKFYINGEETNYEKYSEGVISGWIQWHLVFGRESMRGPSFSFRGMLDEVKIYSRALSSEEIRSNYKKEGGTKSLSMYQLKLGFLKILPLYGQKKLVVDLDMNVLQTDINSKDVIIDVTLLSDKSNVVKQRELKFNMKTPPEQYRLAFNMKDVSSGIYRLKAIIRDEKGKEISNESVKTFTWLPKELEKFKWLDSNAGITDEVLAPWIPIEVEKKGKELIVKVWERAYHFENSIFPTKIETKGKSILAGPIHITAKVNGENVKLELSEVKIEKKSPSLICFTREATGKGLILSGRIQIEYDGMIKIDWKVSSKQDLKLDELTFEIEMKVKHAKYIYTKGSYGPVGYIPKDGWSTPFVPVIWLGDEELGLEWFCESDKDWYNVKPIRSIEVLPQGDVVKLRLHLVDKSIQLKSGVRVEHELGIPIMQPADNVNDLSYTFGLEATPVKPVIKDAWDYRIAGIGAGVDGVPLTRGTGDRFNMEKSVLDSRVKAGVKTIYLSDHWQDAYSSTSTPYVKELKNLVKNCHDRGIQILLYLGMAMANSIPEWTLFNEECVFMSREEWDYTNYPPMPSHIAHDICLRSVWSDYFADGLARTMMDEYDIDGVYLDSTHCTWGGCSNVLHGCGYIGLDGKIKKTYAIFAGRETIRRFYTIIKQRKPDGQIDLHSTTETFIPAVNWVTSYWDGEHLGVVMMLKGLSKKSPTLKKMPLDYFRTEFMGHQFGVPAVFLDYHFTDDPMESFTLSLLHDVPIRVWYYIHPVENLMEEFGRKESEWLPYWKNKEYVTIKPEGMDIYASLYKHPKNGVLAVVSNLGETDVKNVIVQLNLKKLKIKDKEKLFAHTMTVSLSDDKQKWLTLTDEKPINMTDGSFDISLSSRRWKIVWIK